MTEPITAAEVQDAIARLRVNRPLHWDLARRLLVEVLRLRPELARLAGDSAAPPHDPTEKQRPATSP
ncbi:MAG: hypothetical protein CVU56_04610 [Deltaproteobacteria bacterium HGW-Deltaproteobacteria-14]|jgi:hypothetical protein|nr:MAG: hypothetical protein CVU56_04610 [Deltaproteobacteria bacterium HGW-Deltaproteobacteria-14]